MLFQACAYCDHPNPVGTNFCNDCGVGLHLKPCRHCGAVAVAKAVRCPACKAEFPRRPAINVDIPWAVPNRPGTPGLTSGPAVGEGNGEGPVAPHDTRPMPAGAPPLPGRPRARSSPAAPAADPDSRPPRDALASDADAALAATRRLIRQATALPLHGEPTTELVIPPPDAARARRDALRRDAASIGVPSVRAVARPEGRRILGAIDIEPAERRRGPLIVVSLLALIVAVATLFLIQDLGLFNSGPHQQIGSPHRMLVQPAAPSAPVPEDATTALAAPEQPVTAPRPATPSPPVASQPPAPMPSSTQPLPAEAAHAAAAVAALPSVAGPAATAPAVTAPESTSPAVTAPAVTVPPAPAAVQDAPFTPVTSPATLPPTTAPIAVPRVEDGRPSAVDCRPELWALNLCDKVSR